ncbi:TDT family transporter [Yinghuangia sp. ASG 101]|uniref:TDT family transporter n=1 Tax=Yinghuangia sp. ASG 101 TaxID=2896848 RepID=UPI001E296A3C|nr:TDT family transporter [Yinghuangia sp. ASG 101]UGQ13649.1 TDT family transporter [Yinghuangia sp. ASG 101]
MSPSPSRRTRLLRELDRPGDAYRGIGPNWFASVMGTGIVANAAATLPFHVPGLHAVAVLGWLLATALLIALTVATAALWTRQRAIARGHVADPAMVIFFGAPPMALLTVGAGTVLYGPGLLGRSAALGIGTALWSLGTLAGLACAVAVPYVMITRHRSRLDGVFATWLLPVVPPMVSAATGPLLIPHVGGHEARLALFLACYAMFGISLFATLALLPLIWARLFLHGTGPAVMVPTLFIVLGPLGQSVTAAHTIGAVAGDVLPAHLTGACADFALLYGVPVLGAALAWFALAVVLGIRARRRGLPFAMTWWSLTFPVGTCVTGASGLAAQTRAEALRWAAVVLFLLLAAAWAVVGAHTARGCLSGRLFRTPAAPPVPVPAAASDERVRVGAAPAFGRGGDAAGA